MDSGHGRRNGSKGGQHGKDHEMTKAVSVHAPLWLPSSAPLP